MSLAGVLMIAATYPHSYAQQDTERPAKRSFLPEKGSPFEAVQEGGSVLVLSNTSKKEIVGWGEMCLAARGKGYKVVGVFKLDQGRHVEPGGEGADSWSIDGSPLDLCRKLGGILAISNVRFADGSSWKSRWLKSTSH